MHNFRAHDVTSFLVMITVGVYHGLVGLVAFLRKWTPPAIRLLGKVLCWLFAAAVAVVRFADQLLLQADPQTPANGVHRREVAKSALLAGILYLLSHLGLIFPQAGFLVGLVTFTIDVLRRLGHLPPAYFPETSPDHAG